MKILVLGDSHIGCLKRAHDAEQGVSSSHQFIFNLLGKASLSRRKYFEIKESVLIITDEIYRRFLDRLPIENLEIDLLLVSVLFDTLGLIRNKSLWREFSPVTNLGPNEKPISMALLKEIILEDQKYNFQLLEFLKSINQNLCVMESPRIFADHDIFRFINKSKVINLDKFYREVVSSKLTEMEIPILECPRCTYGEDGIMLPEFRSDFPNDRHHANMLYGRLMIDEIISQTSTKKIAS